MRETQAPLSTMAKTNLKHRSDVKMENIQTQHEQWNVVEWWLPIACERGKAARLDVDSAVSVWLILVRWAGLHLWETLISCDGVDLHPALPSLLFSSRRLWWGEREERTADIWEKYNERSREHKIAWRECVVDRKERSKQGENYGG